ncbi:MAG: hypothetical protein ACOVK2_05960 [Candidatus Fonsibacter sp.]
MGYYENPPIINLSSGAEKITAGATSAANSIAEALIRRGDIKRAEEKEQKLTNQKLQDEKNRIDLYYNDHMSDFSKNQPQGSPISGQAKIMLQQKIEYAADARLALTMETDPEKRKASLKLISDAENFMDVASKFGKFSAGEVLTYKETPGIAMNTPGGWAVNASDEKLLETTNSLNIMAGMTQDYESHNIELVDLGGTFAVKISGKKKGGEPFVNTINASDYLNSDGGGTGGFLQKVENVDEFRKQSLKGIVDEKGKMLPGLLMDKMETVKLPSGGGDFYEIIGAQRLNEQAIRSKIKSEAAIKASGYLRGGDTASTRALINSTLEMGPGYYDKVFKKIENVDLQKAELSRLLEENAFKDFTKDYKTTQEGSKTIYWGGNGDVRMVPKKSKDSSGTGGELTANKRLELSELEANAAKQRKKLTNKKDGTPVYSADNKTRIIWDGNAWVRQVKMSSGGYEEDLDSPPIRSKNKAAAEFLGYGLP